MGRGKLATAGFVRRCVLSTTALVFCLGAGAWVPTAKADESRTFSGYETKIVAKARRLYRDGIQAYRTARYEEALGMLRESFDLVRNPACLLYLAEAADRLRSDAEAAAAFKRYLQLVPDSPKRTELQARIRVLQDSAYVQLAERGERRLRVRPVRDWNNRWSEGRKTAADLTLIQRL